MRVDRRSGCNSRDLNFSMERSLMMAKGVFLVYWDPAIELQITYRQLIPVQITIGGLDHTL
ncbi:unnamed protein product [Penicillium roqueforti FM164]|uniref:Uncharacterized protein n=1 Tax=Penicillium roqueforti (strain FM164) TaxID=1365484 RepID=W6QQL2_PENRF|nr:unnamed protein product [Penicillium roqueforti FM164]